MGFQINERFILVHKLLDHLNAYLQQSGLAAASSFVK